jgi:hypothetical protein
VIGVGLVAVGDRRADVVLQDPVAVEVDVQRPAHRVGVLAGGDAAQAVREPVVLDERDGQVQAPPLVPIAAHDI